jgi:hypothetical protein
MLINGFHAQHCTAKNLNTHQPVRCSHVSISFAFATTPSASSRSGRTLHFSLPPDRPTRIARSASCVRYLPMTDTSSLDPLRWVHRCNLRQLLRDSGRCNREQEERPEADLLTAICAPLILLPQSTNGDRLARRRAREQLVYAEQRLNWHDADASKPHLLPAVGLVILQISGGPRPRNGHLPRVVDDSPESLNRWTAALTTASKPA